jgi:hypothetical protein
MEKTKLVFISLVLLLGIVFSLATVLAVPQIDINTANNTEYNTLTPTINVTCSAENASYLVNVTVNAGTLVLSNSPITNATATILTLGTLTARTENNYTVICFNGTYTNNTDGRKVIRVNGQPTVSAVTTNGSSSVRSSVRVFTATWSDQNATGWGTSGTDRVKIFACKTNSFTTNCSANQYYCQATNYETDNSTSCTWTVPTSEMAGLKNYYLFAMDDNSYASSGSGATFNVAVPSFEEEQYEQNTGSENSGGLQETQTTTQTSTQPISFLGMVWWVWMIIIGVVSLAIWLLLKKK